MITVTIIDTPLGPVELEEEGGAIVRSEFVTPSPILPRERERQHALSRYFAGDRHALDALAVAPRGTSFQRRVWAHLRTIPVGKTTTYGEVARALGSSARAVGSANARNPIAIVIPCHRVIGADGTLTGYAGGLERKDWLLAHERRLSGVTLG